MSAIRTKSSHVPFTIIKISRHQNVFALIIRVISLLMHNIRRISTTQANNITIIYEIFSQYFWIGRKCIHCVWESEHYYPLRDGKYNYGNMLPSN